MTLMDVVYNHNLLRSILKAEEYEMLPTFVNTRNMSHDQMKMILTDYIFNKGLIRALMEKKIVTSQEIVWMMNNPYQSCRSSVRKERSLEDDMIFTMEL